MKKLAVIVLSLIICIYSFSISFAESFDLASLTDDELIALKDRVLEEVALRHLDSKNMFGQWYDFGLGQLLPDPKIVFNRAVKNYTSVKFNDDHWFAETLDEVTQEEFDQYVTAVRHYGFNDSITASNISFEADNSNGVHISLALLSNALFVDVSKVSK